MANCHILDPELAALCDDAATWLTMVACSAALMGMTLAQGIDALLPRLHTGYMPESQRRDLRHRRLRDGLDTRGPVNPYDAQRAEASDNGFVNGVYVGAGR